MKPLIENKTIRVSLDHNISSSKILEAKYQLDQTILAVKENISKRYGSDVEFVKLLLRDKQGNNIANLQDQMRTLGSYGAQDGHNILVIDMNPNSIHKQIEDLSSVQKYKISDEDYDKLPDNFKKWKEELFKNNPHLAKQKAPKLDAASYDPDYMKELADEVKVGVRVKLESEARGQVKWVGKSMDLGLGYFVGVLLDEPVGNRSGTIKGVKYFDAPQKYAVFVRPDKIQIGEFPPLDMDDDII